MSRWRPECAASDPIAPHAGGSTASEGMGTMPIDLGAAARRVVDEVKSNIDAITTFPIETEKPIIRELTNRAQVVDIAVSGNVDPLTLKQVTERVRDELTATPGIMQVDIVSAPQYGISIEVSEDDLRRHGMTFDQVADAERRSSLDLPVGSVRTDGAGGRSCCGRSGRRTAGQSSRTWCCGRGRPVAGCSSADVATWWTGSRRRTSTRGSPWLPVQENGRGPEGPVRRVDQDVDSPGLGHSPRRLRQDRRPALGAVAPPWGSIPNAAAAGAAGSRLPPTHPDRDLLPRSPRDVNRRRGADGRGSLPRPVHPGSAATEEWWVGARTRDVPVPRGPPLFPPRQRPPGRVCDPRSEYPKKYWAFR